MPEEPHCQIEPTRRDSWTAPALRRVDARQAQSGGRGDFPDLEAQS